MLAPRLCVRSVIGSGTFADHTNASRSNSSSISSSIRFGFGAHRWRRPHPVLFVSCNSSRGSGASRSTNAEDDSHHQFLEASLLLSETMLHYQMRRQGFQGDKKWKAPGQLTSFSIPGKKPQIGIDLIGEGLLHRFQSPTIFLKISCDGDFLLPIIVGEFAVKKLIESQWEDNNGDYPDQFQLFRDLVEKLGYERGKNDILSVDARPSDAINVAQRCKAPIYVSREIVLTDAIRIGYGMGRMRDAKPTYDVSLDSAADSPDVLSEELDLVKNMDLAVKEERYKDAAMWRDKLVKLRETIHEH
ncbi:bifunctional nuclease 2 isoform X2 [Juglans microcarpa x Juglans regia]|uniref:bifunctional nuclease 2 isoform X2 n=1 Tax=Juglans microcarpa x Juglans regia TaxID=2249226 RepID=UPI001B7F308A|nr:bifunctional nuclease 2 isoform X2 [Juglans microcarpa x Juglans regia]